MPWAVAAAVVGGVISSSASKSAANKQADSAREASQTQAEAMDKQLALQREQYQRADQLAQPAIQGGDLARNRLLYSLGLSPTGTTNGQNALLGSGGNVAAPQPAQTREQLRAQLQGQYTNAGAGTTQPTQNERPDLYQFTGGEGGVMQYQGPPPTAAGPSVTDEAGLNSAVDAKLAQQAADAQQKETARQAQEDAQRAAQADPAYGAMGRSFSASDLGSDPLYDGRAVEAARTRASGAEHDPLYQSALVGAAQNRAMGNDPMAAAFKPAVDAALAGSVSIENDPQYQQWKPQIDAIIARGGDVTKDPQYQQLKPLIDAAMARSTNFQTSPGYEFRRAEGQQGVENSAAARGGLFSGAALKGITRFNSDYASNEYGKWFDQSAADRAFVAGAGNDAYGRVNTDRQFVSGVGNDANNRLISNRNFVSGQNDAAFGRMNTDRNYVSSQNSDYYSRANADRQFVANAGDASFNRFNTNNTNQFNRLTSLTGAGQTAGGNVTTAGQNFASGAGAAYGNYANNVSGLITGNANAQGAAGIAGANALSGGVSGAVNAYQQQQYMNKILAGPTTYGGGTTGTGGYTYGGTSYNNPSAYTAS